MKPATTNGAARYRLPAAAFCGRTLPEDLAMLALDDAAALLALGRGERVEVAVDAAGLRVCGSSG